MQVQPYKAITFVKEGDKTHKASTMAKIPPISLQGASDWELSVNLKRKLVFPQDVVVTSLQPVGLVTQEHKNHHCCWAYGTLGREAGHISPTEKSQIPAPGRQSCFKGVECNELSHWSGLPWVSSKIGELLPAEGGAEPKQLKKATRDIAFFDQGHSRSSWVQLKMAVAEESPQLEPFCRWRLVSLCCPNHAKDAEGFQQCGCLEEFHLGRRSASS